MLDILALIWVNPNPSLDVDLVVLNPFPLSSIIIISSLFISSIVIKALLALLCFRILLNNSEIMA